MAAKLLSLIAVLFIFSHLAVGINITINGVGTVSGITLNNTGSLVDAFWGIPYAKPPIGDLRFAAPQPSEPWSGVHNAHFKIHYCPQFHLVTQKPVGIEDCLYLNIYRPRSSTTRKVPVMVKYLISVTLSNYCEDSFVAGARKEFEYMIKTVYLKIVAIKNTPYDELSYSFNTLISIITGIFIKTCLDVLFLISL